MKRVENPNLKKLSRKTILHIVTGSIAAYKIADLIQLLRGQGAHVQCVMTPSAKHFVTSLVLRAISGQRVYEDFFASDTPHDVLHTELADAADLILVAPASADFIAKAAAGFADDLASCILLAAKKPVLVVPAMNDNMYQHPATQRNMETLKKMGYLIVDPIQGHLVCGREAIGHIASQETILQAIAKQI